MTFNGGAGQGRSVERFRNKFHRGARFIVQSLVGSDSDLLRKLITLGLVSGTCIEVTNIAPLGDPIEFKARGYSLSLRASEADVLNLKSVDSILSTPPLE